MTDLKAATVEELQQRNRWLNQQIVMARKGDPEAQVTQQEGYLEKQGIQEELCSRGENIRPETRKSTPESRAKAQKLTQFNTLEEENADLRRRLVETTQELNRIKAGNGASHV